MYTYMLFVYIMCNTRSMCDGRPSCSLAATDSVFDPRDSLFCPESDKYLNVEYSCRREFQRWYFFWKTNKTSYLNQFYSFKVVKPYLLDTEWRYFVIFIWEMVKMWSFLLVMFLKIQV